MDWIELHLVSYADSITERFIIDDGVFVIYIKNMYVFKPLDWSQSGSSANTFLTSLSGKAFSSYISNNSFSSGPADNGGQNCSCTAVQGTDGMSLTGIST